MNELKTIEKEFIFNDKNLEKMYEDINKKLKDKKLEIFLENNNIENCNYIASVDDKDNHFISMSLCNKRIEKKAEKIGHDFKDVKKAILIHELGEIDYILCDLPTINEGYDLSDFDNSIGDLRVLITHYYLNERIKYYSLDQFVHEILTPEEIIDEIFEELDNVSNWRKIIKLSYLYVTYPKYKIKAEKIEKVDENIKKQVKEIIYLIKNIDFKNILNVENNLKLIIEILNKNGMDNELKANKLPQVEVKSRKK